MNEKIKEENMNILNNFIGYGNPCADFWFMGIEEHSIDKNLNMLEEKERFKIYCKKYNKVQSPFYLTNEELSAKMQEEDKKNAKKSKTYEGYIKMYNEILKNKKQNNFESENIGTKESKFFILNLYPLPRATTNSNYNNFIKEYIYAGTFNEWKKKYWNERKKYISNFRNNYNPKFIFCFGTSRWNDFEKLFGKFEVIKNSDNKYFGKFKNKNIFCLHHPTARKNYFNDDYLKFLKSKIK